MLLLADRYLEILPQQIKRHETVRVRDEVIIEPYPAFRNQALCLLARRHNSRTDEEMRVRKAWPDRAPVDGHHRQLAPRSPFGKDRTRRCFGGGGRIGPVTELCHLVRELYLCQIDFGAAQRPQPVAFLYREFGEELQEAADIRISRVPPELPEVIG